MSAVKNLLGDTDFEMVERLMVEAGLDNIESQEIYERAGGDEAYGFWMLDCGLELVKSWLYDNRDKYSNEDELMFNGSAYMLKTYIKSKKLLN